MRKKMHMNKNIRVVFGTAVLMLLLFGMGDIAFAMNVEGNARSIDGPVNFTQPVKGNWTYMNGNWYFCSTSGEARNRWLCIENEAGVRDWYCFDGRGIMCTGWQKSGSGNWYYLRETADGRQGAMERGFILDPKDGRCYYMDPSTGIMKTGWVSIEGNAYYFAEAGDGGFWAWDAANSKWTSNGNGRPYGSMYLDEQTPDGAFVDAMGRKV